MQPLCRVMEGRKTERKKERRKEKDTVKESISSFEVNSYKQKSREYYYSERIVPRWKQLVSFGRVFGHELRQ